MLGVILGGKYAFVELQKSQSAKIEKASIKGIH